ncbi:MAG: hypothetical protein L0Y35_02775, partial [Flammeovirgaceae bacterium]|nr:hypothetical protein [Flammeovirgaceae bacterium]
RERIFGQADHIRKFGKDYTSRIERAGLKAVEESYASLLSEDVRKRYGLIEEVIFIGRKDSINLVFSS